ncbi:ORF160 [Escherichia phage T5]|uniref:ORF009 n=1 Tax=Escherichia phage T5 TaxID=2695836 RepID=Q5DMD4_BPT5|nr:ORF009 [Escherichia phage T5]AAX12097.1 ORF160 [Escherichia phage T5]
MHRIIWVLFNGEIDSNLTIDHNDRNRANKLPKHIYYNGSRVDNNRKKLFARYS